MAVNPSTPILASDMAVLANTANSKTNLSRANGNNGQAFNQTAFVAISGRGSGYKIGDSVHINTPNIPSNLLVQAVDSVGGIIGLRTVTLGSWSTSGPQPSSPASLIGGSGTGAQVTFAIGGVPAAVAYSFQNYSSFAGRITGPYLVFGGTNYKVGDNIQAGPMAMTVNTVDAGGSILTFTFTNPGIAGASFDPLPLGPLSVTGSVTGSGATFGYYFNMLPSPGWLTELNRLRKNISSFVLSGLPQDRVSGPWPISGLISGAVINGNFAVNENLFQSRNLPFVSDISLYYADTGNQENVTLQCGAGIDSADPNATSNSTKTINCKIQVVGPEPVHLVGGFSFLSTGPNGGTASSDLPVTFTNYFGSGQTYMQGNIDAIVSPGIYNFTATAGGSDSMINRLSSTGFMINVPLNISSTEYTTLVKVTLANPITNSQVVAGVHNSKNILKISIPNSLSSGSPFGIQSYNIINGNVTPIIYGWRDSGGTAIVQSVPGFWVGICEAVVSLNSVTPINMPWNLIRTQKTSPAYNYNPMIGLPVITSTLSGSTVHARTGYDYTKPLELQIEPQTWQPGRQYDIGAMILDSNSNWQVVAVAGISAASHPVWPLVVGQICLDNTITWSAFSIADKSITPAQGRFSECVSRYPIYWQNETIASLKPPVTSSDSEKTIWGCGSQWQRHLNGASFDAGWQQDNLALGWWIYGVTLNRLGTNGIVSVPQNGQISVTIGCFRNGSFTTFGTYNTGQTVHVLWPVFTSDALVYQCSERVDIQVLAIASGGTGVSIGINAVHPICAAHYNDTEILLSKIT